MYKPQRVHPLAILEFTVRKIYSWGQALLPLLIIAIAQQEIRKWLLLSIPVLLAFFIAYGILYWLRYVFYISEQELRLEYGVLLRKKRYISFNRIQTVQISAGVLQRVFGLAKIQVETAGGGSKAEFVLTALPRTRAEELQQILQAGGSFAGASMVEKQGIEYKLSTRSLLLLASTSNGIGVVLSAMLVIVSQLNDWFPKLDVWKKAEIYAGQLVTAKISLIAAVILILLLLAWLLSLLGTIIQFGGFQLSRAGNTIHIRRGLFEKQQITIPIKRIQAVRVVEGLLRQPMGMVSVQVVSISNTGTKGEGNVLFPLLPKAELAAFMEQVIPEFSTPWRLQGLPARSRRRYLLVNIIPALVAAAACTIYLPWGYLAFFLPLLGIVLGNRQYKDAGYQLADNKLILRSRILGRVTTIIPRRRIQSLHVSQNPFQARSSLSSLKVRIASSHHAAIVKLKGMDIEKSRNILDCCS